MAYTPNILNKYDTYTYNIKISMVNPTNFSNEEFIAENSTDASLNISSVTQTLVLGHSIVRSSYANQFDIIIHEPNNVTFFERIVRTAGKLGIKNHTHATYKIEISFPGRDSSGKPVRYPKSKPFTYYVKFLKVDANITERGAEYIIQAVETNSKGYSYINAVTKSTLTYKASNVNEALSEFEKVLNEAAEIHNETNINSLKPDTYKIQLADDTTDWGKWEIEINDKTPNVEGDKMLFHITSGSKIDDHIANILKATREFKEIPLVNGGFAKPLDKEVSDESAIGLKYHYKVIPSIKEVEFDPLRGDYIKEITFIIKKHVVPEGIIDANEISNSINSKANQSKILKEYFDTGLLTKKYDYLYTGQNTEVLKFDIKLQYAYYLISPIFGGQVDHSNLRDREELSQQVKSTKSAKSKYVQARNAIRNDRERAAFGGTIELERAREEFAEAADQLWDTAKNTPLPTYQSDVVDNAYSYVPENDEQAVALSRFGSIQANIENSGDLVEIELGIRGDPYWLGNPTGQETFSENAAPYELGGPMFFLNINLPVPENSAGLRIPSSEYYISGVYKVINVISEFRNGQFIQYLKAVRMTKILTDVMSDSLKSGKVSGPVQTSSNTTTQTSTEESTTTSNTQKAQNTPVVQPRSRTGSDNIKEPDVPQERQNTPVNVEEQATERATTGLDTVSVLGTFGYPNNYSAIIRNSDGTTQAIKSGDTFLNGIVTKVDTVTRQVTLERAGREILINPIE